MTRRRILLLMLYASPPSRTLPYETMHLEPPEVCDELLEVRRRRYQEARAAGLSVAEAQLFADSDVDVGFLRMLVRDGCSTELIAAIVV